MTNDDHDPQGSTLAGPEQPATQPLHPAGQPLDPPTQPIRLPPSAADGQSAAGGRLVSDGRAAADGQAGAGGQPPGDGPSADGTDPAGDQTQPDQKDKPAKKGSFWRELPVLLVIALAIALLIKTFAVQMFFIPSGSMQDTLQIGDRVMVNKLVYRFRSIQPGDIVVFDGNGSWDPEPAAAKPSPDPLVRVWDATVDRLFHSFVGMFNGAAQDNIFIKRVIGVPGDHVACCNASGDVTVNGVPLQEQGYLYPGNTPGSAPSPAAGHFSMTVPPGRLWVLGDHRAISADSRLHEQDPADGTVPESAVIGRAFVIVWPPSRWRFLPIPSTFNQSGINGTRAAAAFAGSSGPFLPLAAGFGIALPLTWAQRRLRRRLLRRRLVPHGFPPGLWRRRAGPR